MGTGVPKTNLEQVHQLLENQFAYRPEIHDHNLAERRS